MNRRLLTILTVAAAASLAAGCSTLDNDTVAQVGDTKLSQQELDDLLVDQEVFDNQSIDVSRQAISNWIFETTVDQGFVSEEILAGLSEEELIPSYSAGIEVAGITCPTIFVADSETSGEDAVASLDGGVSVADVVAEYNIDPQLATTGGLAGCFPIDQFDPQAASSPEVEALFSLSEENRYASAPTAGPDGSTAALVVGFRPFEDLDANEAGQVVDVLRQAVGLRLLVDDIDIDVASRYGTFDVDRGGVVPLG